MSAIFQVSKVFFGFLLAYSAWLQVNDPDPIFWIIMYLTCAMVPLITLGKINAGFINITASLAAILCVIAMMLTWQGMLEYLSMHLSNESLLNDMSLDKPYIEEGREFIGTLIALVVVIVCWYYSPARSKLSK